MSKIIAILLVSLIFLGGCSLTSNSYNKKIEDLSAEPANLREINIGTAEIMVEVAKTNAERARGLSYRDFLDTDRGMIFIFDKAAQYNFWMKDMKFPLDFIWINNDKVVEVTKNVPAPSSEKPRPVTIMPEVPVTSVIEVNAGWVESAGVLVGQQVKGLTGL